MNLYIWTFDSTGEAYDACQSSDAILKGDILLIAGERVIGIADTWPVAITKRSGKLHHAIEGECGSYLLENNLDPHLAEAILLAGTLRFSLLDEFNSPLTIKNSSLTRKYVRDTITLAETLLELADPEGPTGAIFDEIANEFALSGIRETLAEIKSDIEDMARDRGITS